jgi:hypothetical protein
MLMWLVNLVLTLAALALAVPAFVFVVECLLALLPGTDDLPLPRVAKPLRKAVLIAAHDEESRLAATLRTIMPQLGADDRCVVVADHCSDGTAQVARAAGAQLLEYSHPSARGKGFALAFGLEQLAQDPPDIVILVEAGSELSDGAVDALARLAHASERPVQADSLVMPERPTALTMVSVLAWLVRNRVRARGLRAIDMPCHLTGSGMGFTWDLLRKAPPTGVDRVEELRSGLELAMLGHPPLYTGHARVIGTLPALSAAVREEHWRRERDLISAAREQAPRFLREGLRQERPELFALGLDLLVPPLTLLVVLLALGWLAAVLALWLGSNAWPLVILTLALGGVGTMVLASWWRFARAIVPAQHVLAIPLYILWKVPVYAAHVPRGGAER